MTQQLAGRTILVAEDEYFLAADLKRALIGQGATVLGPVGELAGAMALVDRRDIDSAIIDVNLAGTLSYPLADRLTASDVPFLFLTGYDGWALPEAYRSANRLSKPCFVDKVVETLGELMTRAEPC